MIQVSENNLEIYQLLEKSGQLFLDFSIDKLIAFDEEDDFHIVIYSATSRIFILFTAKNCMQDTNVLPDLINSIQEYSNSAIYSLIEQSIRLVENKMHSKNNSRFFFDAH